MSVSYIPEKIKFRLWGKAAGRCQYSGCNRPLWLDSLTKAEFNTAYIAHIIADKPNGPRGHPELSKQLKSDISNLMLMCDEHHRLIDREDVAGHPVERLRAMKAEHESRIELLTSIQEEKQSHVLLYGANIGEHSAPLSWKNAAMAMVPSYYPAESTALELGLKNSSFQDSQDNFWDIERDHLHANFAKMIKSRIANDDIQHLSVFALAPQPLLIELGRLLSDIPDTEIFQLHREPQQTWGWQNDGAQIEFVLTQPEGAVQSNIVALKLALSATVTDTRIQDILGSDVPIWSITANNPHNDILRHRDDLGELRSLLRQTFDRIKAAHGENAEIHVFPVLPVSAAVEVGRTWMPKADLPMVVYDQNNKKGGFCPALKIQS